MKIGSLALNRMVVLGSFCVCVRLGVYAEGGIDLALGRTLKRDSWVTVGEE